MRKLSLILFVLATLYSTKCVANSYYETSEYSASSEMESAPIAAAPPSRLPTYQPTKKFSHPTKKTVALKKLRKHTKKIIDPDEIETSYHSRLPAQFASGGEKVIIIDPKKHVWGGYDTNGKLIRAGLATAGARYCHDVRRPCMTKSGTFRIQTLGDSRCKSRKYPIGKGGAPMPYCMYFNGAQGLHGSYELAEANMSHGCVRVSVEDARWLRNNFVKIGTKVIVKPY
jgi:lipoprotein-anchoring transpeptidase ErfK/SrfK